MIHSKPYRKDSGIEITPENPYFTKPGRSQRRAYERSMIPRKVARSGEYAQVIGHWDEAHHKFIQEKVIIHQKRD